MAIASLKTLPAPMVPCPSPEQQEQDARLYPESDGKPISDHTLQFEWITLIKEGLESLFADRADVFVAGDLLWYPVEDEPNIRMAPDVLVAFGRPKGHRGSYIQWREGNTAPQVVFEVLSPGNRFGEMVRKQAFYDRHGVEEYYLYDPFRRDLTGWVRDTRIGELEEIDPMQGWVSPRLGIRFEQARDGELALFRPDNERFRSYLEIERLREQAEREREQAERERDLERQAREQAERERDSLAAERERLAARLRELGIDPDNGG